jgi:23S rRNA pseudouridine1911/1915/1917 synthase
MPDLTKHVSSADAGRTVGQVLKTDFRVSASMLKKLKSGCLISVNGMFARTNQILREGDLVRAALGSLPESADAVPPDDTPISILYEDSALIALDKQAGIIVHPSTAQATGTVANGLARYYRARGYSAKIHPVSRLDRETTGVILFAKDSHTKQLMSSAMKRREYAKEYVAIASGAPHPASGAVELPIGRAPGSIMLRRVDAMGKPAKTSYEVIARAGQWSLVKLFPVTGRTHQIRVHMAALGCPLLADGLYNGTEPSAVGTELRATGTGSSAAGAEPSAVGTELRAAGTGSSAAGTELSAASAGPGDVGAIPGAIRALSNAVGPDANTADASQCAACASSGAACALTLAASPSLACSAASAPPCPALPGGAMRRQALHAWRVSFAHPYSNEQITIKAPPPQDFLRTAALLFDLKM